MKILEVVKRTKDDTLMRKFLRDAVFTVSAEDARGWFRYCGYF